MRCYTRITNLTTLVVVALSLTISRSHFYAEDESQPEGSSQEKSKPKESDSIKPVFGKDWTIPGLGLEMIWIEPGTFVMGGPKGEYVHEKQHEVTISRGFWLGKYEVTVEQFRKFIADTGYRTELEWRRHPFRIFVRGEAESGREFGRHWANVYADNPRNPVVAVSRLDIIAFCLWVNHIEHQREERLKIYRSIFADDFYGYTLPTESQWEYACRAGTTTSFSFGNSISPSEANCNWGYNMIGETMVPKGSGRPVKVGSYPPNQWGLHDMHGNVNELCLDRLAESDGESVVEPVGVGTWINQTVRGGSFWEQASMCRSGFRMAIGGDATDDRGFRLALSYGPLP